MSDRLALANKWRMDSINYSPSMLRCYPWCPNNYGGARSVSTNCTLKESGSHWIHQTIFFNLLSRQFSSSPTGNCQCVSTSWRLIMRHCQSIPYAHCLRPAPRGCALSTRTRNQSGLKARHRPGGAVVPGRDRDSRTKRPTRAWTTTAKRRRILSFLAACTRHYTLSAGKKSGFKKRCSKEGRERGREQGVDLTAHEGDRRKTVTVRNFGSCFGAGERQRSAQSPRASTTTPQTGRDPY